MNDDWLSRNIRKTEHDLDNLRKHKLKSALHTRTFWHLIGEERRLHTRLKHLQRRLPAQAPPDGSALEEYYPPTQTPQTSARPTTTRLRRQRQRPNPLTYLAVACGMVLLALLTIGGYRARERQASPEPDIASALHQFSWHAVQALATAQPQPAASLQSQRVVQPAPAIIVQSTVSPHPPGDYRLLSPPSLKPSQIDDILRSYQSPATGTGHVWYRLGMQYDIDPAFALVFFVHESTAGTHANWVGHKPDGTTTHNIGNIICAGYETCYNGFRDYPTWEAGIEDWYRLMADEYIEQRGLHTIADVIPVYAPPRATSGYIGSLEYMVDAWRRKYRTPAAEEQAP